MSKSLEELFAIGFEGMNDLMKEVDGITYNGGEPNVAYFMLQGMFQMMVKMDAIIEVLVEIRDQEKSQGPMHVRKQMMEIFKQRGPVRADKD